MAAALSQDFNGYAAKLYPLLAPDWPPQRSPRRATGPNPPAILLVPNEVPMIEPWIYLTRPDPQLYTLPDNVIQSIGSFCLNPHDLLRFSSTCRKFAILLRNVLCWLDHHHGRGFDIGILEIKAKQAAAHPDLKYGATGWGLLVKSASDKWEFPDDNVQTQIARGTPVPHMELILDWKHKGEQGENPADTYQARGVYWMKVMYDLVTEYECRNFLLYEFLHDEAVHMKVHDKHSRFFQALIAAAQLMNGQWQATQGSLLTTLRANYCTTELIRDIGNFDKTKTSKESLTHALLCAVKMMLCDKFQWNRRMYPHPPLGPRMWFEDNGTISLTGHGWISQVRKVWKGHVQVIGEFTKIMEGCVLNSPELGRGTMRMKLDFRPDGTISGNGNDFGGDFMITGTYHKTAVSLEKRYLDEDQDEEDISTYYATGQMLPWGIYGDWACEEGPNAVVRGYWGIWIYEGASPVAFPSRFQLGENFIEIIPKPYTPDPDWYETLDELQKAEKLYPIRILIFPQQDEVSFSDVETEYEDEVLDQESKVIQPRAKKPKVKVWAI